MIVTACLCCISGVIGQTKISQSAPETITIENAPDQEVIAVAKNVLVKKSARGVLVFGGDAIIEGQISGDVAVIGGSVIQKSGGRISGDVFVFGGSYRPESGEPLRSPGRETLVYAGYEAELREYARNPSLLFSPAISWSFLIQRLFSLLFWFVVGFLMTLISPGGVSRAVTRFRVSGLNVFAIGAAGFLLLTIGVIASVAVFPGFVGGLLGLMAFVLIILAYVFGRVVLQVSTGKWFLRLFNWDKKPSETLAILIGAFLWTLILSLPFIWVAALFVLFSMGIGLVLTVRKENGWKAA
ncbi:MAG: polymer-forming cytoskeletal protein [Acidobacteriota bacterium]|nr:polymer-forming cytoskeletal protein [Acidobacteriota bacterium]MDH3530513.1 polymer-forming cytoskeletal protein [Acidobacteriota bacterium]